MKLIIDIDEKWESKCSCLSDRDIMDFLYGIVRNGTPIPDIDNNLCNSCTNYKCEFQSGIVRTKCAFYMPPHIEPDKEEQLKKLKAELAYAKFRCAYLQENQELLPMGRYGG